MSVVVKRIYEPIAPRENAEIDTWLKEVAPSAELRKWFHGGEGNFAEFRKKYLAELKQNPALKELKALVKENRKVTLLYGAKNEEENHAIILATLLI
jgi:uncharacterized protein YeaO (DUF488 family)